MFKVSVIIPVYNAVKYIERAVESIIHQEGVGEVILIDDGYPDGALELCQQLVNKYSNLVLYQHPNGVNKGAGASRNLGIKKSKFSYIAFLDADDYCLPNRFQVTKERFEASKDIDAIYEPVGTDYINEEARQIFSNWKGLSLTETQNYLTYPNKETAGKEFFLSLIDGSLGYPHLCGITIKKNLIERVGQFNEDLKLHQDTEFLIRLAYHGHFVPGDKKHIVANRLVHLENRISHVNYKSRYKLMKALNEWGKDENIPNEYLRILQKKYIIAKTRNLFNSNSIFVKIIYNIHYRLRFK